MKHNNGINDLKRELQEDIERDFYNEIPINYQSFQSTFWKLQRLEEEKEEINTLNIDMRNIKKEGKV